MKKFLLTSLKFILKKLAQRTISKYRPGIIGVTGNVGKTSTKMAIASVLGTERNIRYAKGNFNNELGLPVAILGDWEKISGTLFWFKVAIMGLVRLVSKTDYPEILVLEYGIDRPGDMDYLLEIAQPNIGVLTAIGEIPVHVEFFGGPEGVAEEKWKLIESLPAGGVAILNYDDHAVMKARERTKANVMTYGFGRGADVRVRNFENEVDDGMPDGISFRLEYLGRGFNICIPGALGKSQAYAAAAAANVGLIFGINTSNISAALERYSPAPHRLQVQTGIKSSVLIDDSYNASPAAMEAALNVLHDLPGKRKVAVLGDMLEIGKYTIPAHEKMGKLAAKWADVIVSVGPRAKFIYETAIRSGFNKKNAFAFERYEDAVETVQNAVKKGDVILIKGSRAMQLDKLADALKEKSSV